MKISEVKTCFKIADVSWDGKGTKLSFDYLENLKDENGKELPSSILKENISRVYLIVVDGIIKKIGCSEDKGGMKGTLSIYKDGGVKGRPSIRSFGIWYFLFHAITKGHKIEFYMIYQENFSAKVKGLFGYHNVKNASISPKLLEECCTLDYRSVENNNFPDWNIQEQASDWPTEIKQQHAKIMEESSKKKLAKGRKEAKQS